MKCPDALTIQSFVDGELPADESARVQTHIEECAKCRMLAQDLQTTQGALSSVGSVSAPGGLFDSIHHAVATRGEGVDCATAHELISASVDHELTDEEAVALAEHLADCPDCAHYAKSMGALVEVLQSVEQITPPEGLRERIEKAVAAIREETGVFDLFRRRWKTGAAVVATAAAAAAIIFALILHGGQPAPEWTPTPDQPQIVEEATPDQPAAERDIPTPEEASETAISQQPAEQPAESTEAEDTSGTPDSPQPASERHVATRPEPMPQPSTTPAPAAEEPDSVSESSNGDIAVAEGPAVAETTADAEMAEQPATDPHEKTAAGETRVATSRTDVDLPPLVGSRPVDLERTRARDLGRGSALRSRDFKKSDIAEKPVAVAMVMESGRADLPKSPEARLSKARPDSSEPTDHDTSVSATPASYPPSSGGGKWLPSSEPDKSVYQGSADSNDRLLESGRRISESIKNLRDQESKALLVID